MAPRTSIRGRARAQLAPRLGARSQADSSENALRTTPSPLPAAGGATSPPRPAPRWHSTGEHRHALFCVRPTLLCVHYFWIMEL
jgi:hypothetical protein